MSKKAPAPISTPAEPDQDHLVFAILCGTALIGTSYLLGFFPSLDGIWSAGTMILGVATVMIALTALGIVNSQRIGSSLGIVLASTFILLILILGAALLLPPEVGDGTGLLLGLPRRAALVVYGIGILPLFILPIAYALTFEGEVELDSVEGLAPATDHRSERERAR